MGFPIITPDLQREFETKTKMFNGSDFTPEICGHYGRACRCMNDPQGANRALCMNCPLANF